ncbi:MAG: glycosyltransferase family 9 protein [Legionellaceae bacterium]|nr:glycosyltransferase family 9 protein [Legionellaceae bacterium]
MINSICLVRLSALGDVLMFVPLVRALQRHYPQAKITWIISPFAYTLVDEMEEIEFIVLDKPKSLADYWRFKQRLRGRKFDVLLAAQASFRANCLYPCIRAKRKIGYDKARAKDGHRWFVREAIQPGREHTLEGFLKFGAALGVPHAPPVWKLPVNDAAYAWARSHIQSEDMPVLVVNPAASKSERSWFAASYVEVIRFVLSRWKLQVILIGGPGPQDKALGDAIASEVPVTNLIGQSTPKQLLALIDLATLVLCPDTGPAHMAAAMGTPVIALHAVTNVDISGPYVYRHLAVNAYLKALERVNQSVDTAPWGTQVHEPWAMTLISVDMVMARLNCFLSQL